MGNPKVKAAALVRRFSDSPRLMARVAGTLYLLAILTAIMSTLWHIPDKIGVSTGVIFGLINFPLALILCGILRAVNTKLSYFVALLGFAQLVIDIFPWYPQSLNLSMGCAGLEWIVVGFLILRSTFMPRILGMFAVLSGLGWTSLLWWSLLQHLLVYLLASSMLGEGIIYLWLLAMGVNDQRWRSQFGGMGAAIVVH